MLLPVIVLPSSLSPSVSRIVPMSWFEAVRYAFSDCSSPARARLWVE